MTPDIPNAGSSTRDLTLLRDLQQPSPAYRRKVWGAVLGLLVFVAFYALLASWFLFTAYRLTLGAAAFDFTGYLVGLSALLLAVFMLKPLFFIKRGGTKGAVEVTEQQEPRLFRFIYDIADAARAPRPRRVFISARVNASVFYDLSLLNLIFPSQKNLEIGLGLVNALSLGEFRAVLAHEFGHFTQRSMAVGRWVSIAQQVATHVVARRDKLDAFLRGLSRANFRIAWVGWLVSLIVWSIRAIVDSAFRGIILLAHALSREMELQADLVAVSLTGSDALVHALHRLQAADDSWMRTLAYATSERQENRIPRDLFTLQARFLDRLGQILQESEYSPVPPVPRERPGEHRVFKPDLAQPPQMWLTHPLNHEREANAKRNYVTAPIDERTAWVLFDAPPKLREQLTAVVLQSQGTDPLPGEESLRALDEWFDRESLKSRYRGVYIGRSVVRGAARPELLVAPAPPGWRDQLDALYPATVSDDLAHWRLLRQESAQLRALHDGSLKPSDGVVRHRGQTIRPRDLPRRIDLVEGEAAAVDARLCAHDQLCRTVHQAAAAELGGEWAPYLEGLRAVLHYAEHTAANLRDLHGVLARTVQAVTITGRVSSSGVQRVVDAANALHTALGGAFREVRTVELDAALAGRLHGSPWAALLEGYSLPPPSNENIRQWLDTIGGWVGRAVDALQALSRTTLDELLRTESVVADHVRRGTTPDPAPSPSVVRAQYPTLAPDAERSRDIPLTWWDRFQIAHGVIPGVARATVAVIIVVGVLAYGRSLGKTDITIYNGLALPVVIDVGGRHVSVRARGFEMVSVDGRAGYRIEARTHSGQLVDTLRTELSGTFGSFVYNVAGATPLVEWTAIYGPAEPRPPRMLGAPRWASTSADVLFERPPEQVKTDVHGAVRLVLSGLADAPPIQQLAALANQADTQRVLTAHVQWDATNSARIATWLELAARALPDHRRIIAQRLEATPSDVLLLRVEQDWALGADRDSVCARDRRRSLAAPFDPDLSYIATRCLMDPAVRSQAFLDGYRRWPHNGWFAYAAGLVHTDADQWGEALVALTEAHQSLPAFAEEVAVDLARLHRMVDADPSAVVAHLAKTSEHLSNLRALETGAGLDSGPLLAYPELARGHLERALDLSQSDSSVGERVLRLAAASDGARPDVIRRAMALRGDAGLDDGTRWASIGLATRLGRDRTRFLAGTERWPREYTDRILRFIDRARSSADRTSAEQALKGLPLFLRGEAYSAGTIILGSRAPETWRRAAQRLLFAPERPYFK